MFETVRMDALGSENVGIKGIDEILDTPPVHAKHTIYTTIMNIRDDYYR